MYSENIIYYAKNPTNKWELKDYSVKYYEENRNCWDDLVIYLKIEDNKITDYSFEWETAIITTACASILWEAIIWMDIKEILELKQDFIIEILESEISHRRRNASVLALLATRNAIHSYLKDWIKDDFSDVLE